MVIVSVHHLILSFWFIVFYSFSYYKYPVSYLSSSFFLHFHLQTFGVMAFCVPRSLTPPGLSLHAEVHISPGWYQLHRQVCKRLRSKHFWSAHAFVWYRHRLVGPAVTAVLKELTCQHHLAWVFKKVCYFVCSSEKLRHWKGILVSMRCFTGRVPHKVYPSLISSRRLFSSGTNWWVS